MWDVELMGLGRSPLATWPPAGIAVGPDLGDQLVHALRGQTCSVTDQTFPIGRREPTLPQATPDLIHP